MFVRGRGRRTFFRSPSWFVVEQAKKIKKLKQLPLSRGGWMMKLSEKVKRNFI